MKNNTISKFDIWYASEDTALSIYKKLVYDEIGHFSYDNVSNRLTFIGKNFKIDSCEVQAIDWGAQRLNWVAYLLTAAPLILIMAGRHDSLLYAVLMTMAGVIIGISCFYLFSRKWIKILYSDKDNAIQSAYFFDGGYLGYRGIFGGTKKLFNLLETAFFSRLVK